MNKNTKDNIVIKDGKIINTKISPKAPIIISIISIIICIICFIKTNQISNTVNASTKLSIIAPMFILVSSFALLVFTWVVYLIALSINKKKNGNKKWRLPLLLAALIIIISLAIPIIIDLIEAKKFII